MVASTNATRLFAGTRWTNNTLLEREYQMGLEAQKKDGLRRVFLFTAEDVRKAVPAYGETVDGAIARLGRQHPLVKTQFFCETVGMGTETLRATSLQNAGRDSTFLKIVEVDTSAVNVVGKPTYRAVFRMAWTGASQVAVFGVLKALVEKWHPQYIVIDATGVGEGLWSMLDNAYGEKTVLPVKFTVQLKSALGYGLLGMIDSGRYQEYHPFDETFQRQLDYCRSEILPGAGKLMRWGVPDGTRDRASGEPVHDDDLITSAMCAILDRMEWRISLPTTWTTPRDPLEEMDRNF
jgi:hypothetical protein